MRLGYIGLGKMGFNMVARLLEKGYEVVAFDPDQEALRNAARLGARPVDSLDLLPPMLDTPRLLWLMVPHKAMDSALATLTPALSKADTVIDGGNSFYKDSMRRAKELGEKGIDFLDAGVSGGPSGARNGACIMVGGRKDVFQAIEQLFRALSVENGYGYMGPSGAGHFVKMVHNGIEYGMMQSLAEGFTLLRSSPFALNLEKVADLYNHMSVIESRLVEWLRNAFAEYGEALEDISGSVESTGEGAWTVETAKELGVPVPIIEGALTFRTASRSYPSYTGRILSALRNQFGSHDVFKKRR